MRLPYSRQTVGAEEAAAVAAVLASPLLTGGPTLARFEGALAETVGARHAIALSSGTAALHVAYRAAGLAAGDRVVTSPLTFVATASAAVHCGADPVFADVDGHGLLDADAVREAVAAGPPPRVVVPVHYAGHPAPVASIAAAARSALVVEDACHALGALALDAGATWQAIGSCADSAMAVFSFHPVKTITTGEGGAIVTNDAGLAARCRRLRDHGLVRTPPAGVEWPGGWYYECEEPGFNYRLSDLHAALGVVQLSRLEELIARRRVVAEAYDVALADLPGVHPVTPISGTRSAYHLYPVRIPARARARVFATLRARDIGVQVHYIPVHLQPYYRRLLGTSPGDLPKAEEFYAEVLSLPCFPGMTPGDVQEVVVALAAALAADQPSRVEDVNGHHAW